jgi:hypothetical protein
LAPLMSAPGGKADIVASPKITQVRTGIGSMGAFRQEESEAPSDPKIAHFHLGLIDFDFDIPFTPVEAVQPRHHHYCTRRGSRLIHAHRERSRGFQMRRQPINSDVVALLMVSLKLCNSLLDDLICSQASSVVTPRFVASISV